MTKKIIYSMGENYYEHLQTGGSIDTDLKTKHSESQQ